MSCSNCNKSNCSCSDNCPTLTSDITTFDGVFNMIEVPCGSSLNDVLALLEDFSINITSSVTTFSFLEGNCLGLPEGNYTLQQVLDELIDRICTCPLFVEIQTSGVKQLTATVSGGTSPYTYSWSFKDNINVLTFGGATNTNTVNVTGTTGAFALPTCTVTDANGCKVSSSFLWVSPAD